MRELDKFLSSATRELRNLGPIERRRALSQIRQDVMELAVDGKVEPPGSKDISRAITDMPEPEKLARAYLRTSRPPVLLIKVASGLNAVLGLGPAILAGFILMAMTDAMWVHPVFFVGVILLLLSGVFVFAVYALAALSPMRVTRLRFVILVPMTLCIIVDSLFIIVALVHFADIAVPDIVLFTLFLLGGIYSVSYVHRQLPRLDRTRLVPMKKRNYFLALDSLLSELDLVRRKEVVEELEQHIESRGLRIAGLKPREAFSQIEEILGPPEDVAEAYLREAPKELSKRQKRILAIVLVPAIIGVPLGGAIIVWGFSLENRVLDDPEYLTPLALIGSMGLLLLSLVVVGYVARMFRAPSKWVGHLFPAAVLSLVSALIISATVAGFVSDGIARPSDRYTYSLTFTHIAGDGGLDILWSESRCSYDSPVVACEPVGDPKLSLTRLDAERRIISTESLSWGPVRGQLLDFQRVEDTWVTLFSDRLVTWGTHDRHISGIIPPGSDFVSGRIYDYNAIIVSEIYSASRDSVSITYRKFNWLDYDDELLWSRDFDLGVNERLTTSWNEDSVLVLKRSYEDNENYSRSALVGHLFDKAGNSVVNMTVLEVNETKFGSEETSVSLWIDASDEGNDAFWLSSTSRVIHNGTETTTSWLTRIDGFDGTATSRSVHEESVPVSSYPHEDGDISLWVFQSMFVTEYRVIVASSWDFSVWRNGSSQVDPSLGGRYLASVVAEGDIEYNVRLGDVASHHSGFPLISSWGDSVSVLVPSIPTVGGDNLVTAYLLHGATSTVEVHEISVDYEPGGLLSLLSLLGKSDGIAVAPGVSDFVGTSESLDLGLFGWKYQSPGGWIHFAENFVEIPLFVRIDVDKERITSVLLTPPKYPPDTVAGLLLTGLGASIAVASLHFGYRQARMRSRRKINKLERPLLTE